MREDFLGGRALREGKSRPIIVRRFLVSKVELGLVSQGRNSLYRCRCIISTEVEKTWWSNETREKCFRYRGEKELGLKIEGDQNKGLVEL